MGMRTWIRKMAHQKAEMMELEKVNKPRWFQGKKQPSIFAANWRRIAAQKLPKPVRKTREAST